MHLLASFGHSAKSLCAHAHTEIEISCSSSEDDFFQILEANFFLFEELRTLSSIFNDVKLLECLGDNVLPW